MVIIEAMACGTPVAAYPSPGPIDIIIEGVNGAIDLDLVQAVQRALTVSRTATADHAKRHYSWKESTKQFIEIISP
jgi:glycosyltransferase involved in cell wall biosynthesis